MPVFLQVIIAWIAIGGLVKIITLKNKYKTLLKEYNSILDNINTKDK